MAKDYVYFQGKGKWCKFTVPDQKFQKWGCDLYFTEKSLAEFKALNLRNHLKMDEDGFYSRIACPVDKLIKGTKVAFLPPKVFDKDSLPLDGTLVGNGSDLTLKCEVYKYTPPGAKEKSKAIRLESVRVDNLVPYEPKKDFTDVETKAAAGLMEQPEQLF